MAGRRGRARLWRGRHAPCLTSPVSCGPDHDKDTCTGSGKEADVSFPLLPLTGSPPQRARGNGAKGWAPFSRHAARCALPEGLPPPGGPAAPGKDQKSKERRRKKRRKEREGPPHGRSSRPAAPSMGRAFPLFPSFFSSSFLALLVLARRGGATRWRQSFRQRTACRMSGEWGPSLCAVAACPLWRAPCKGQKREGNVRLLPAPCAGVFVVIRPAGDRRRQARGMSSPPKTRTSPSSRHRRSRSRTAPGP